MPIPSAEKHAAFTPAVVRRATPTAVKWAAQRLRYRRRTGSIYRGRSAKGGTNRGEMGSITRIPPAKNGQYLP